MYEDKPADLSRRERFPQLRERYGEDPARFLDQTLIEQGPDHTATSGQMLAKARIRGIDSLERIRVWMAVERRIERGPRKAVMEWLQEREAWLLEHGDREDRLDFDAIPPREERVHPRTAEEYDQMPTPTPMPESYKLWGSPSERLAEKARKRAREAEQGDDQDDTADEDHISDVFYGLEDQLDPGVAADGGKIEEGGA